MQEDADSLEVAIPTNKVDVLREVDVIEEILRIYGFDRIPISSYLSSAITASQNDYKFLAKNQVSQQLVGAGFSEVMNVSLVNSTLQKESLEEVEQVGILNSSNAGLDVLRADLVFGILQTIARNQNRKAGDLQLFEFGKHYWSEEKGLQEKEDLAIMVTGKVNDGDWRSATRARDFYDLKTAVANVFQRLGMNYYRISELEDKLYQFGLEYKIGRDSVAKAGLVSKELCKKMGVKGDVFMAKLDWSILMKLYSKKPLNFKELDKFPAIQRDLSLLLDKSVRFSQVEEIARKKGGKLLTDIGLFDVYEDKKMGENKRSYAVSFTFQDSSKTLTKKEVDAIMENLIAKLEKGLGVTLKD